MRETFDPRNHKYTVWRDADGVEHNLKDMSDRHIQACAVTITQRTPSGKSSKYAPVSVDDITSPEWCAWFGEGYLKAFRAELKKRKDRPIDF